MLEAYRRKGLSAEKMFEFPNGEKLPETSEIPSRGRFRVRHGFGERDILVLYSGNIGVKQGLEILVEAAGLIRDQRIKFVICGEGAQKKSLVQRAVDLGLRNVCWLGLQPECEYHEMLVDADLCVITQQKGSGKNFFPSKLLTTLAYAKPVLTVADPESELAIAINTGRFGPNVPPGDAAKLAVEIERVATCADELAQLGRAGRRFVEQFEIGSVLRAFEQQLERLAGGAVASGVISNKPVIKGAK